MSKGQKHTAGPWEIDADSRTLRQQLLMGGIAIKAYAPRYDEKCAIFNISTNKTFGGDDVTEANARLIAAAPTMYEGIGDFLAAYDRARIGDWDHGKLIDWLGEQVARLRPIHTKAEGR